MQGIIWTYNSEATLLAGDFVSILLNILLVYCKTWQTLFTVLFHSLNSSETFNSPVSIFIAGWNTSLSNITFWKLEFYWFINWWE